MALIRTARQGLNSAGAQVESTWYDVIVLATFAEVAPKSFSYTLSLRSTMKVMSPEDRIPPDKRWR
jgi:hypothetical protein